MVAIFYIAHQINYREPYACPVSEGPVNFLYVIPVFILGFGFMWLFATGLISLIGGWHSLAKSHPAPGRSMGQGTEFSFQSVRIGLLGNYRSCVNVTVLNEGLLLRPIVLYRFLHRPIFIAWERMSGHREENFLFFKGISFMAGTKKIGVSGSCHEEIWRRVRAAG